MTEINACLMFDGNCAEAMKFYQKCLKVDLHLTLYSEVLTDKYGIDWMFSFEQPKNIN